MALVRNTSEHGTPLTVGYLAPAEERNIDVSPAWEQQLITIGTLLVVDPDEIPPAPAEPFSNSSRRMFLASGEPDLRRGDLWIDRDDGTVYEETTDGPEVVGTVGVDESLLIPLTQKAAANGVASLDGTGKLPIAQLPTDVMEFKGVWNASTNTPTLANGAGNPGDYYRVSVAATRNLGSGNIKFAVGDAAILNASSVWEKAAGAGIADAIAVTPLSNLAGTDVQAVLADLNTRVPAVESGNLPLFNAKGDLVAATANDTGARVAVGTDGQVLTADAASAAGVKWAAAAAASAVTLTAGRLTVTDTAVPAAPTLLSTLTVGATAVRVRFTDNETRETSFEVQRDTNSGFTAPTTLTDRAGNNDFIDIVPLAATVYYYRVRAVRDTLTSTWSNTATTGAGIAQYAPLLYLDARYPGAAYADADPVPVWGAAPGSSTDAYQGTAGNRPTYRTNSGFPAIRFDGTDDFLSTYLAAAYKPFTFFAVFKPTNFTTIRTLVDGTVVSGLHVHTNATTGMLEFDKGAAAVVGVSTTAASTSLRTLVSFTYTGAGVWTWRINRATAGTGTNDQTFAVTGTLQIGKSFQASMLWLGDMHMLALVTSALALADVQAVENDLQAIWSTP